MANPTSRNGFAILDAEAHYNSREKKLHRIEPSWARAAMALREGPRFAHGATSIRGMSLPTLHEVLGVYRKRLNAGDNLAILDAVDVCALENIPLPEWLAVAFSEAMQCFWSPSGPLSLDAVFGSPRIPGGRSMKRAAAVRQDQALGVQIYVAMWNAAHENPALTSFDSILQRVLSNQRLGVKKVKARALFLQAEKRQLEFLAAMGSRSQPLSRFLAKRRKQFSK